MAGSDVSRLATSLDGHGILKPRVWRAENLAIVHRQHVFTPQDAGEAMPLSGPSGLCVVADCRLGDRDGLCGTLGIPRTQTDGMLVRAAFERWGADAPRHLHGEFSLAAWDGNNRRLVLARDPAGYRTLYFHRGDRVIAFATRLRALLSLAEVPRDLDDRALADFLILNNGPPARTIYRAIDRVPMGHVAVLDAKGLNVSAYWTMPEPGTLRRPNDRAYEEEARDVIDRVVGDALRTQGRPTLLLTAGLDSTAIAESATRQLAPDRLLAVTRAPAERPQDTDRTYHDETARVGRLAAHLPGLDWHAVGDDGGAWRDFDFDRHFFLAAAAPSRAPQNIAWFFPVYRFMTERSSRVSIGGEMGNMFFSFSGLPFLPGMLLRFRWARLLSEVRALARREKTGFPTMFARAVLSPLEPLPLRMMRKGEGPHCWSGHSALSTGFAEELMLDATLDRKLYRMRVGGGHHAIRALRQWVLGDETARDFHGSLRAITGTDHRVPLADRRVMAFFGALPPEQFLRGGITRFIARRLLAGRLPDPIVLGNARGVQNGDWYAILSAQRASIRASLDRLRARPKVGRVVDLNLLGSLLDNWPDDADAAETGRRRYLQMLTRGMEMARFIAWHEGGNS